MKSFLIIALLITPQLICADMFMSLGAGRFNSNQSVPTSFIGSIETGFKLRHIAISFQVMHLTQEVRPMNRGGAFREGELTMMPLFINFEGYVPINKSLQFHMGGGIGYVSPSKTIHPTLYDLHLRKGEEVKERIDQGIMHQIRGGLEARVSRRMAISFDAAYVIFETDARFIRRNTRALRNTKHIDSFNVDLGSIVGMITARFYF